MSATGGGRAPGLFGTVEDTIDGAVEFAGRVVRTLWLTSVRPRTLAREISPGQPGRIARPFSFLAFVVLAYVVFSVVALGFLNYDSGGSSLLEQANLLRMVMPWLVAVLVVAYVASLAVSGFRPRLRARIVALFGYVAGWQMVMIFGSVTTFLLMEELRTEPKVVHLNAGDVDWELVRFGVWAVLVVALPAVSAFLGLRTLVGRQQRVRLLAVSIGFALLSGLIPLLMWTVPAAASDWSLRRTLAQPALGVVALDAEVAPDRHLIRLRVLVQNQRPWALMLRDRAGARAAALAASRDVRAAIDPVPEVEVAAWEAGDAPIMRLEPGEEKWLVLHLREPGGIAGAIHSVDPAATDRLWLEADLSIALVPSPAAPPLLPPDTSAVFGVRVLADVRD